MASTSISNFVSFIAPSKPPPPKTPLLHLSLPSNFLVPSSSSSTRKTSVGFLVPPLVASTNYEGCRPLEYASFNVQLMVEEDEPEEQLVTRFRREVYRAGVIQEVRRRRYFETTQEAKKRKNREAAKRNRRRRTPFRSAAQERQEQEDAAQSKKDDDLDDDNWELPEGVGDLPF